VLSFVLVENGQDINDAERTADKVSQTWNESAYRDAAKLYRSIADRWLSARNLQKYTECLRKAAGLHIRLNELDEAEGLLEVALATDERAKNVAGQAQAVSELTKIAIWREKPSVADSLQKRARALAEEAGGPEVMAEALFAAAAFQYRNQRNLFLMKELQEKALELFRVSGDKEGEAETLTDLAFTAVMNNDRQTGQELARQAVELARSISCSRCLAFGLIALGDAYQRVGRWGKAYEAFKESESLFPDNVDLPEKANLFARFTVYYETFNDLVNARDYCRRARYLYTETNNLFGSSEAAIKIGQISGKLGDEDDAVENFDQGLAIARRLNDKATLAFAYENIGEFYFSKQHFAQSIGFYRKAAANYEKVGIKYAVASVLEKLGQVYSSVRDNRSSRKLYAIALEMNRSVQSKAGQASNLYHLAKLHRSERKFDLSLSEATECIRLTDVLQNETENAKFRRGFFSEVYDRYALYISLLMDIYQRSGEKRYEAEALIASERSRARVLLENITFSDSNAVTDADGETLRREEEIRSRLSVMADTLTDLLGRNSPRADIERLETQISGLQNELEEIRAALKQSSAQYAEIKDPPKFDIDDFQKTVLDEDTLLLEFSLNDDKSYLWAVSKHGVQSYLLPPRNRIESEVESLRELLGQRGIMAQESIEDYQRRIAETERRYLQEVRILSDLLFGQARSIILGKRLIFVSDGKLLSFPAGALPDPNSNNNEPVLSNHEVVYEPSASVLAFLKHNVKKHEVQDDKDLIVFADPLFSAEDPRIVKNVRPGPDEVSDGRVSRTYRYVESLDSLPRLIESKQEADAIVDVVGKARSRIYTDSSASVENALDRSISDYRIIHFATHGYLSESHPELSGIVLSQFGESGEKKNGLLRLQDIYSMQLNSDLIVLSACSTGIGKEIRGEGLMSLNNAFLQAGSKSVLSSMWKVDDVATKELMQGFYEELVYRDRKPSEALRIAQMRLQKDPRFSSPFYWAGFTLQGDFANSVSFTRTTRDRYYYFGLVPVLLMMLYAFRKMRSFYPKIEGRNR